MAPASGPVGVLALQGNFAEHMSRLRDLGAGVREIRTPDQLEAISGLVIPGGESTAMWRLAVAYGFFEPLRRLIASGFPVFGSCAGMIMLADRLADGVAGQQTYGGIDMTVQRNAFGRQVDSFECDLPLAALGGDPVHAVFIRAPFVLKVGADVDVLAEVDGHPVAVRQGRLMAVAFHPELVPDERRLHQLFLAQVHAWRDSSASP